MKRRNGKPIHTHALKPAPKELLGACRDVFDRVVKVCIDHRNIKGMDLAPPTHLSGDWIRWRTMVVRFDKGDFRYAESELKSMEAIMRWAYETNCELRNQPIKKVE